LGNFTVIWAQYRKQHKTKIWRRLCSLRALITWFVFCTVRQVWFSDLKEETESQYSVGTKETTPLSKTGPFVFEGPYEADQTDSNSQLHNGQTPATATATATATLDLSSPAAQY